MIRVLCLQAVLSNPLPVLYISIIILSLSYLKALVCFDYEILPVEESRLVLPSFRNAFCPYYDCTGHRVFGYRKRQGVLA